ncbi:ribonuclease P protein component [Arcticibacterium luteifluviistationis]|uniref:Ribonuclease P protein component n=1 Tax=Arcticibacterium luteifluviistationis TaxID=1784714 RepID=A0A2Z4GDX9_9BACT|nr:ribonuclease P protein component [Arcticibacterium luteifluviistationis]AWV99113.1 ribonuclease P protein component [Arcticibacterium luteifluviistationis]
MDKSFNKSERLCHVKVIEGLFNRKDKQNKSLSSFPILMIYSLNELDERSFSKVLFSVPKRKFKRAVDRNLLKRRLKEAYRLNKNLISGKSNYNIAFLYIAKQIEDFSLLEASMVKLLTNFKD